jgi:hypothetical protein
MHMHQLQQVVFACIITKKKKNVCVLRWGLLSTLTIKKVLGRNGLHVVVNV